jgi:hypothetical protein
MAGLVDTVILADLTPVAAVAGAAETPDMSTRGRGPPAAR